MSEKMNKSRRSSRRLANDESAMQGTSRQSTPYQFSDTPCSKAVGKSAQKRAAGGGGGAKPAEVFSTHYITAMKINDCDNFDLEKCLLLADSWRHEWNNGVQVPVAPELLPVAVTKHLTGDEVITNPPEKHLVQSPHKLMRAPPKRKRHQETANVDAKSTVGVGPANVDADGANVSDFDSTRHMVSECFKRAKGNPNSDGDICWYDTDDLDLAWLQLENNQSESKGSLLSVLEFERVLEALERLCHERIQQALINPQILNIGREFEDDSVCDVCMSPNSDDEDAIVFCDGCDLCVHQSCYGIGPLPTGQWLCRPCSLAPGKQVQCLLCPNSGGALKCTKSGERWAHISCVLWIPEVKFGEPESFEPVINISKIPPGRWQLRCALCTRRDAAQLGACIQCSRGSCHVAYHVTCAQRRRLEMRILTNTTGHSTNALRESDDGDSGGEEIEANEHTQQQLLRQHQDDYGIKLVSYCLKHSRHQGSGGSGGLFDNADANHHKTPVSPQKLTATACTSGGADATTSATRRTPKLTVESPRKRKARRERALETRFFLYVSCDEIAKLLPHIAREKLERVYEYWKMKRKWKANGALMTPKSIEEKMKARYEEEALIRRAKALLALRQNLEKARNLAYMLERREKLKRQHLSCYEQIFDHLHSDSRTMDRDRLATSALKPTTRYEIATEALRNRLFPSPLNEHTSTTTTTCSSSVSSSTIGTATTSPTTVVNTVPTPSIRLQMPTLAPQRNTHSHHRTSPNFSTSVLSMGIPRNGFAANGLTTSPNVRRDKNYNLTPYPLLTRIDAAEYDGVSTRRSANINHLSKLPPGQHTPKRLALSKRRYSGHVRMTPPISTRHLRGMVSPRSVTPKNGAVRTVLRRISNNDESSMDSSNARRRQTQR